MDVFSDGVGSFVVNCNGLLDILLCDFSGLVLFLEC
nr:MAG TPA: hypothetical protein [Caudoviricetes sp.]